MSYEGESPAVRPFARQTSAVNCFTSGVAYVCDKLGVELTESDLLVAGSGFQFRAGLDEYGYPEFIFDVIRTSDMAIARFGSRLEKREIIDPQDIHSLIIGPLSSGPVIVWVNSKYMSYSSVYHQRDPYIHAIVVESYDEKTGQFAVFDPLITDRHPQEVHANLPLGDLELALFERVKGNELAPEMGTIFAIKETHCFNSAYETSAELRRQASANLKLDQHRRAVSIYRELCLDAFSKGDDHAAQAGRRLFDHINVLFVVPSFFHLKKALLRTTNSRNALRVLNEAERLWRELSILALKYQATKRADIVSSIDRKFGLIEECHNRLWAELCVDDTRQTVGGA